MEVLGGKKPGRAVQPPSARRDLSFHRRQGPAARPSPPTREPPRAGLPTLGPTEGRRPGPAAEGEGEAPAEAGTGRGDRPLRAGPAGAEAAERRQHPATGSRRRGAGTACEESRAGPASGTRPREVTAVGRGEPPLLGDREPPARGEALRGGGAA